MSLLSMTSKRVVDVATFIKENASANKLRYSTEADATHRVYFPLHDVGNGTYAPYVLAAPVHTWGEGTSFDSCLCIKGIQDGGVYDGVCPVCERLNDAAEIVKYVKAGKEAACTLVGDARKKFLDVLDKELWRSRKVSPARTKYYVALVLLKCDKDGRALVEGEGPQFTVHIASWQESFMQTLLAALTMQDEEPNIGGREFKLKYGDYSDVMTRVGQCQVSLVDDKKMLVKNDTQLAAAISEAMSGFDFIRSVELSRPEAKEKAPADIKISMNSLFREWDNYKAELAVNSDAKYLEYAGVAAISAASTEAPSGAPVGALTDGAQSGTIGGEISLDELDAALGL